MPNLFLQRYQNITKIGEGGTAVVYSAWDTTLERKVAIKRVKDELTQDKNFLKRSKSFSKTQASKCANYL